MCMDGRGDIGIAVRVVVVHIVIIIIIVVHHHVGVGTKLRL